MHSIIAVISLIIAVNVFGASQPVLPTPEPIHFGITRNACHFEKGTLVKDSFFSSWEDCANGVVNKALAIEQDRDQCKAKLNAIENAKKETK